MSRDVSTRHNKIALALVLVGVALRGRELAANRSLWNDEAALALNLHERSYASLWTPLDHEQVAPVGFLWTIKALMGALGEREWVMRLPAFVASVAAIPLFWMWARRIVGPEAALIGLLLMCVTPRHVAYAAELKPYAVDLAVSILVLLCATTSSKRAWETKHFVCLGAACVVGVWLSLTAAFVVAGVIIAGFVACAYEHRKAACAGLVILGLLSAASFALHVLPLRVASGSQYLQAFWIDKGGFMPHAGAAAMLSWPFRAMYGLFSDPMKAGYPPIAAALALMGVVAISRARPRVAAAGPLLAIAFGLAAGAARLYPFQGRLAFFAAPFVCAAVAMGIVVIAIAARGYRRCLLLLLVLLVASESVARSAREFAAPRGREEVRQVVAFIAEHRRAQDHIAVYAADLTYCYYAPRFGLPESEHVVVHDSVEAERATRAAQSEGRRIWFVFAHLAYSEGVDHEGAIMRRVREFSSAVEQIHADGAAAYLVQ